MASCNRLRRLVAQICAAESATEPDPPLGSLEGYSPRLRAWTVAEILASKVELRQPGVFPSALPDGHPAVAQFRQFGYVVITDAVAPESLSQAQATFRAKQPFAKQVAALRQAEPRPGHPADVSMRYYDLPREDMDLADSDTLNGSHGSFLVTRQESDFDSYMGVLANPRVLPLLLALAGPAMHLLEVGARTVEAPPLEQALLHGGYTEWHRDAGGRSRDAVAHASPSSQLAPTRLPIGFEGCDYNRVKCFAMLTDVTPDGGPLGLVPGSHLWWGSPPDEYKSGSNMCGMPGHVKVAVPAGGMCLFGTCRPSFSVPCGAYQAVILPDPLCYSLFFGHITHTALGPLQISACGTPGCPTPTAKPVRA